MNRRSLYPAVLFGIWLGLCVQAPAATPGVLSAASATQPANARILFPDYSSPRRAVETFIWAVKSHDSAKISACLYGQTPLEQKAAGAFADMTAAMGSMLADAKKKLGPPPGGEHTPSVTARLNALLAALPASKVSIKANHATIEFPKQNAPHTQGPLYLIRHGARWKLDIQAMLHLKQPGLTVRIIKRRIADETAFTRLLQSIDADVRSGKIKTWRQFTVDFESHMLAAAARREARKQAAGHSTK